MTTPKLRVVEMYDDAGTIRILLDEGQDFERFYREFAVQDAAYEAGEIDDGEHLNFEQFAAARGIRVIDPVAWDRLEIFYGPDQGGEQPSVRCQFCGRTVPRSTSHLHGNGWVGDCCKPPNEQERATSVVQVAPRREDTLPYEATMTRIAFCAE